MCCHDRKLDSDVEIPVTPWVGFYRECFHLIIVITRNIKDD